MKRNLIYTLLACLLSFTGVGLVTGKEKTMLTNESFAKAKGFLKHNARPLEQRLFEYYFENGSRAAAIAELAKFQNSDGGFGRALEPDIRMESSSPAATIVGLRVLKDLNAQGNEPVVAKAIQYLIATHDSGKGYWPAVPKEVNSAPHAPWWQFDDKTGKCVVESPAFPAAEFALFLRTWPTLSPSGFTDKVTASVIRHLSSAPDHIQQADLVAYLHLSEELHDAATSERLKREADVAVVRDSQQWTKYVTQPLWLVSSPDSMLFGGMRREVDENLDYLIRTQEADGGWSPNWNWYGAYPEAWEQARVEWRGFNTLQNLRTLRAFGRLDGSEAGS